MRHDHRCYRRNRYLREPESEHRAAHRLQLWQAELEADGKHEEHDAELGKIADIGIVGHPGERMRADCNANDEIAEDRRKAKKTAGNDHDDGRRQQQQNELQCLWHRESSAHRSPDANVAQRRSSARRGWAILARMSAPIRAAEPVPAVGIEPERVLKLARDVLATEAAAIRALEARLGAAFLAAARALFECRGRVVVTGIGKSGHIARKLAATLASTGTPAFFVHATEASHGDLGMITADDIVLLLSNSGETDELVSLIPHFKRQGAKLIALTGNEQSSLAFAADVHLDARGFSVEDFARSHPGGSLGRKLLTHVRDVMRPGVALPSGPLTASFAAAVVEMSGKGMGMTAVIDQDRRVAGIFTDGDLRRCIPKVRDLSTANVAELMTANPRTIGPDRLAIDCVELMEAPPKVSQLLIVDDERRLVGALHLHDLFRAKVV